MLESLIRLQINRDLALPYPTIESIHKKAEDYKTLPLGAYLEKYYKELDIYSNEIWNKVMLKLVNPAFEPEKHDEMIYNFGYISKDKHDFHKQDFFYRELKSDTRLDEETRKFIGVMAGNHFFDKYIISINEWFNSLYWTVPSLLSDPAFSMNHTINEILNQPYGLNYFKSVLLRLDWWKR
jgi:hypothetical protein